MQAIVMAWCLLGVTGDCPACDGAGAGVCEQCGDAEVKGWHYRNLRPDSLRNAMPQSCYDPRFGCYPGNNRHLHRYPAFHGAFYRAPYNYRQVFEYPWHAEPHEPQPLCAPLPEMSQSALMDRALPSLLREPQLPDALPQLEPTPAP